MPSGRCKAAQILGLALVVSTWAAPAAAHVLSLSSGELRLEGDRALLEVSLPLYETEHLERPERETLNAFRIWVDGEEASRQSGRCREEPSDDSYRCSAVYTLPESARSVEVECLLARVVSPNHVHVLQALRAAQTEQAVFDYASTRREIRFRPQSLAGRWAEETAAGAMRVIAGPALLLFLLALALAARSRQELSALALSFCSAQAAVAGLALAQGWSPPERFLEAAAALTVAYLAVEVLALPKGSARWLVAAGLGVFHGLYFAAFLRDSVFEPQRFLLGAVVVEGALIFGFWLGVSLLRRTAPQLRPTAALASVLLVIGLGWFFLRLGS